MKKRLRVVRSWIDRVPLLAPLGDAALSLLTRLRFRGSGDYWESRYAAGSSSGAGSYGRLADFKAEVLNAFVARHQVASVIEFGCGDGNQLTLARYPSYIGLDVARSAIQLCLARFREDHTKSFFVYDPDGFADNHGLFQADLALSLDVLYHLVEDAVYERYMRTLFAAGGRFVIIYSSNFEAPARHAAHVRHRRFTDWIERHRPEWRLIEHLPNRYPAQPGQDGGSFADFYLFQKGAPAAARE